MEECFVCSRGSGALAAATQQQACSTNCQHAQRGRFRGGIVGADAQRGKQDGLIQASLIIGRDGKVWIGQAEIAKQKRIGDRLRCKPPDRARFVQR